MFQNNKCQKRRLYVLLVLSLLFKTVPTFPLGIGPVLGFVSGFYSQKFMSRKCPGEPEATIRRSYRVLLELIEDFIMHPNEEYFENKKTRIEKKIQENNKLFAIVREELKIHKPKVNECDFGSSDHITKRRLEKNELTANEWVVLATQARELFDKIEDGEQDLIVVKEKLGRLQVKKAEK